MGHRIRHVWEQDYVVASFQDFIPGNHFSDSKNEIRGKAISPRKLNRFFHHLWETFPDYNLVHFGIDLQNLKLNFRGDTMKVMITDLAAHVEQQAGGFERGKRY